MLLARLLQQTKDEVVRDEFSKAAVRISPLTLRISWIPLGLHIPSSCCPEVVPFLSWLVRYGSLGDQRQ